MQLIVCRTRSWDQRTGDYPPTAYWDEAEAPIKNHAAGDALAILDCCYASTAATKSRDEESRTYQLLAASSEEGYTSGPGGKSFTTALCDSLEQLLQDADGGTFSVVQLQEMINTKRTTRAALTWDQLKRYGHNIELGRLDHRPERDASFQREEQEKASLTLRLSLTEKELADKKIEHFARLFNKACKDAKLPVRQMQWVGMQQRDTVVRTVINTFRKGIKRRSIPGNAQEEASCSGCKLRKRSSDPETTPPPPKRRERRRSSTSDELLASGERTPRSDTSSVNRDD